MRANEVMLSLHAMGAPLYKPSHRRAVQLLLWVLALLACFTQLAFGIGVNYGMKGNNLPPPQQVVELLKGTYIDSVKLYNADAEVLAAFANSGISLVLGVENELIVPLARSPRAAKIWVKQHIKPFYPATSIAAIAVGNEVLTGDDRKLMALLVPAMNNLHLALLGMDLHEKVKISTPSSMAVLSVSSPPSSATFRAPILPYVKQLLQFLAHTASPFMVNAYPYFAYAADPKGVSLEYALFSAKQGVMDKRTGFTYGSLFDAQVDAVYFAIKAAGFRGHMSLIVSESGWPSMGDKNETGATMQNAQIYNSNLVNRLKSGVGTPLMPNEPIPTYVFALFNENEKPGPLSERNFGLFEPSKAMVYDAGLTKASPSDGNGGQDTPPQSSGGQVQQGPSGVWCVASPGASQAHLQQIINFACGEGGADCSAIQNGNACFSPDTLASHASYAMNSYYQHHGRNYWNCFFNSGGLVTATNPSYGPCTYPSQ
ncbi:hypothetical protein GOP47_0007052 [Adiantum capillus-veneris]|uniref:glucan endo-1,3-beta-D-glucosidase n=1 Tax=Adiantum capillus-veneris TaxID=13818 RepID=A0A9D4ZIU1_ADICA|nr:hypothetical protein GOP47_0007052 [Adiantum capillus-veneris]